MAEVKTYNREFSRVTSRTAVTGRSRALAPTQDRYPHWFSVLAGRRGLPKSEPFPALDL